MVVGKLVACDDRRRGLVVVRFLVLKETFEFVFLGVDALGKGGNGLSLFGHGLLVGGGQLFEGFQSFAEMENDEMLIAFRVDFLSFVTTIKPKTIFTVLVPFIFEKSGIVGIQLVFQLVRKQMRFLVASMLLVMTQKAEITRCWIVARLADSRAVDAYDTIEIRNGQVHIVNHLVETSSRCLVKEFGFVVSHPAHVKTIRLIYISNVVVGSGKPVRFVNRHCGWVGWLVGCFTSRKSVDVICWIGGGQFYCLSTIQIIKNKKLLY